MELVVEVELMKEDESSLSDRVRTTLFVCG